MAGVSLFRLCWIDSNLPNSSVDLRLPKGSCLLHRQASNRHLARRLALRKKE